MKNKIIICVVAVVLVVGLVIVAKVLQNKKYENYEIVEISYSYGGGYGTIIDSAGKTITFTEDGKVVFSNGYNDYVESYDMDLDKLNELKQFIKSRASLFDEKPREENGVMDGGSSHISIKLKDGQTKSIGGYMISNKNFNQIKEKIYETIDTNKFDEYAKKLRTLE